MKLASAREADIDQRLVQLYSRADFVRRSFAWHFPSRCCDNGTRQGGRFDPTRNNVNQLDIRAAGIDCITMPLGRRECKELDDYGLHAIWATLSFGGSVGASRPRLWPLGDFARPIAPSAA